MKAKTIKARKGASFWPWFLYAVALSVTNLILISNAFTP